MLVCNDIVLETLKIIPYIDQPENHAAKHIYSVAMSTRTDYRTYQYVLSLMMFSHSVQSIPKNHQINFASIQIKIVIVIKN